MVSRVKIPHNIPHLIKIYEFLQLFTGRYMLAQKSVNKKIYYKLGSWQPNATPQLVLIRGKIHFIPEN